MREERSVSQAMVARATWLLPAAGATLQWDGGSEAYRDVGLSDGLGAGVAVVLSGERTTCHSTPSTTVLDDGRDLPRADAPRAGDRVG